MKRKTNLLLLICLLLCLFGCNDNKKTNDDNSLPVDKTEPTKPVNYFYSTYSNPTLVTYENGSYYKSEIADPSIVRGDDGYFYLFATGRKAFVSEDACNFVLLTDNIIDPPTWWNEVYDTNPGAHVWAPDVVKVGDKWIYYYSLSGWGACCGIGYAVSDNITGPYQDMGKLFTWQEMEIYNAIDPQVIIDDDGQVYMTVGSFQGLYLLELTADGQGLLGGLEWQRENKKLIAGKVGNWDGSTYEGGYIIKKDNYYYYFGSVGTCCEGSKSSYHVRVGRSESITGPYTDSKNRPLTMSGNGITIGEYVVMVSPGNGVLAGPGHNSILKDDAGDYWIYYHSYSKADNFSTRHLFLDKLSWSEDGWPYVEYNYVDEETGEEKSTKIKPSYEIELNGPRFILD